MTMSVGPGDIAAIFVEAAALGRTVPWRRKLEYGSLIIYPNLDEHERKRANLRGLSPEAKRAHHRAVKRARYANRPLEAQRELPVEQCRRCGAFVAYWGNRLAPHTTDGRPCRHQPYRARVVRLQAPFVVPEGVRQEVCVCGSILEWRPGVALPIHLGGGCRGAIREAC